MILRKKVRRKMGSYKLEIMWGNEGIIFTTNTLEDFKEELLSRIKELKGKKIEIKIKIKGEEERK